MKNFNLDAILEAMLKMSEIEKLMVEPGIRRLAQLLPTVSARRISHSNPTGCRTRSKTE